MPDQMYVDTSGGLITTTFIGSIREESFNHPYVKPETFTLPGEDAPSPKEFADNIAVTWDLLLEQWELVRSNPRDMDVSRARTRWMLPLLQMLDFEPQFQRAHISIGEMSFDLSHRGWPKDEAPMLSLVEPKQDLDEGMSDKRGAKSPHDVIQAYLNASEQRWGLVTNGLVIRLLRDYHHTYTKGYVEFDLESIFETKSFTDFRALYRMCHASRFRPDDDGKSPLEHFYETSLSTGVQAGADLRDNVVAAIETLGNGFLSGDLIVRLQEDEEACRDFYSEVLIIVYRILFLLFAEQRGMMPGRESLYADEYSVTRLRERAEGRIPLRDDHHDLWDGFMVTCQMVRDGVPELNVFGYNGELFSDFDKRAHRLGKQSIVSGLHCRNSDFLQAVRHLTLIEQDNVLQRISYADLGVEEIGSVYESLLEFTPRVTREAEEVDGRDIPANRFFLDPRGSERKTTGSYYTHPSLVNLLIESALVPVMEERLADAVGEDTWQAVGGGREDDQPGTPLIVRHWRDANEDIRQAAEEALLDLNVCDPACGSGAFLIAAMNSLGLELARIRTGEEYPSEDKVRHARRDVLAHCIYGVDLNAMAVELCKVSLWIDCSVDDMPLNFLDHHIKAGNSLVGATPELMAEGIPDEAFQAVEFDATSIASKIRARNTAEREGAMSLPFQAEAPKLANLSEEYRALDSIPETDIGGVECKADTYAELVKSATHRYAQLLADFWCSAFFWPLDGSTQQYPTEQEYRRLEQSPHAVPSVLKNEVQLLAEKHAFFHWHIEFPHVFADGGFDCVLGNPPWERVKSGQEQRSEGALAALARQNGFLRHSSRFHHLGSTDVNTYAVFVALAMDITGEHGRAGQVVPTGIATDQPNCTLFEAIFGGGRLVSLYDFLNGEKSLFPSLHRQYRYCLLTLRGQSSKCSAAPFAFFLGCPEDIRRPETIIEMTYEDVVLLNPNTKTCPSFRCRQDAELTISVYDTCGVLVNEEAEHNPWQMEIRRLFDMNSAKVKRERRVREELACAQDDTPWMLEETSSNESYVGVWEGKLFHQYDHRFATYEGIAQSSVGNGNPKMLGPRAKNDSACLALPRYWLPLKSLTEKLTAGQSETNWLIGCRDCTNATNERTCIAAVLPAFAADKTVRVLFSAEPDTRLRTCILANLNTLVLDYLARNKIAGSHLSEYIIKQLALIPPDQYRESDVRFVVQRVLELAYTAHDVQPFARDMGYDGEPFPWDPERRPHLRAQLDAYYARLYGLNREELHYILDPKDVHGEDFPSETFRVLKDNEMRDFGEFRTKRLVLAYFDAYEDGDFDAWVK